MRIGICLNVPVVCTWKHFRIPLHSGRSSCHSRPGERQVVPGGSGVAVSVHNIMVIGRFPQRGFVGAVAIT